MKPYLVKIVFTIIFITITFSCKDQKNENSKRIAQNSIVQNSLVSRQPLSEAFKKYWYAGDAEITSYKLEQARYGQLRQGTAVLIYVTEPFVPGLQVKADKKNANNIPVLKLNTSKKFLTGIYPYAIMTSSFYPVYDNQHAEKISFSSQEWCGQVYAQLNNRLDFEVMSHSYFGSEGDQNLNLQKTDLEDEVWNKIRLNPKRLKTGEIAMIPSFEFVRLTHKTLKAYKAIATLTSKDTLSTYEIFYPELERKLKITFSSNFPYTIEGWSDSYKGGYGQEAKILTSTATKIKTLKTPYWSKNDNKNVHLRDSLGLKK